MIPYQYCPHCGSNIGFYVLTRQTEAIHYKYNFDGSEAYNGEMYDKVGWNSSLYTYCCNCNKRLFKSALIDKES